MTQKNLNQMFGLTSNTRVRISSTFSVPFSYLRPFRYFDQPTLLRPKLYFDLNFTSTFLAKLYFDQNFTLPLRAKLCFSTNKKSRFYKMSKYASRSKADEVKRSKYRKGRTNAYPEHPSPYPNKSKYVGKYF